VRKPNRDDLTNEASDTHLIRTFTHAVGDNRFDVTEHILLDFDRDFDNKPINLMVWDSGPSPRPFVHRRFTDIHNVDTVREGMKTTFDGIDWEWWCKRHAAIERGEVNDQDDRENEE
jgi:hypothetical protein